MQLLTIAAMLVAGVGVMFALQNSVPVTVNFIFWRFDSSLALVLLLALALGGLIVGLISTPSTLRRQWKSARQAIRITELEKQVENQQKIIAEQLSKSAKAAPASISSNSAGEDYVAANILPPP